MLRSGVLIVLVMMCVNLVVAEEFGRLWPHVQKLFESARYDEALAGVMSLRKQERSGWRLQRIYSLETRIYLKQGKLKQAMECIRLLEGLRFDGRHRCSEKTSVCLLKAEVRMAAGDRIGVSQALLPILSLDVSENQWYASYYYYRAADLALHGGGDPELSRRFLARFDAYSDDKHSSTLEAVRILREYMNDLE